MAPHVQRIGVTERRGRNWSLGIIRARQKFLGLFVSNYVCRAYTKAAGTANVVGMREAVDQVSEWSGCDFGNSFRDHRSKRLWNIHQHHAVLVDKKHGLDGIVRNHIEVFAQVLNSITLGGVYDWSLCRLRHIHVFSDA